MEKISHIWSVICSSSLTDLNTNNISLINLVEKYSLKIKKEEYAKIKDETKIVIPFNQEIVSRFIKNVKDENVIFDIRVDIVTPSGKTIEGKEVKTINFDKKFGNFRIRNFVSQITVDGSGLHYFSVKIKNVGEAKFVEVGSIPVELNINIE